MSFLKSPATAEESKELSDNQPRRLSSFPHPVRNEVIAFAGEFCGTFSFLFMGFTAAGIAVSATPANDKTADTINLLFIALTFGASLAANVWAFFRISGGLFNPAVSIPILRLISSLLKEYLIGYTWPILSRCIETHTCHSRLRCTNSWWHRGSCSC